MSEQAKSNISAEPHNAHALAYVEWLRSMCCNGSKDRLDGHVRAFKGWLRSLRSNRDKTRHDGQVQARNAWALGLVKPYCLPLDGHLLWMGTHSRQQPRVDVPEGNGRRQYVVRRLVYAAITGSNTTPSPEIGIAPTCGDWRCLSCLTPRLRRGEGSGTPRDGIRTLEDLRMRCDVDERCGCWRWKRGVDQDGYPVMRYIDPKTGKPIKASGRRAALHLSRGKQVPRQHWAFATEQCTFKDCVNPEHSTSGVRSTHDLYQSKSESGHSMVEQMREMAKRSCVLSPEHAVNVIRRLATEGITQAELADELGVSRNIINRVVKGRRKCDVAPKAAPNASIFALAQSMGKAA